MIVGCLLYKGRSAGRRIVLDLLYNIEWDNIHVSTRQYQYNNKQINIC